MRSNYIKFRNSVALILVISLLFNCLDFFVSAQDNIPETNQLNGWYVDCFWGNGSKTYNLVSSSKEDIDVKLTVEYYAPLSVMTSNVEAGTVHFSIPDIGGVRRGGAKFQPVTVADSLDSDWSYTYDPDTQRYVFTNKTTFLANKPLSGGFEMRWKLSSRECTDGYYLKQNPIFTLGSESIKMPPVEFSCNTNRDYYRLSMYKEYLDYNESLGNGISNDDYITYVYRSYFSVYERARGAEYNTYFVKVAIDDDGITDEQYSQIIVRYNNKNSYLSKIKFPYSDEEVWGFYCFIDNQTEALSTDLFTISYPRTLDGKNAIVDTYLSVHYYDEDTDEYVNYLSSNLNSGEKLTAGVSAPIKFYTYVYGSGGYDFAKTNSYESYTHQQDGTYSGLEKTYAEKYLSKNIFNNEPVRFTLTGHYTLNTTASSASSRAFHTTSSSAGGEITDPSVDLTTTFDMVLGDDRLYVKKNDNTLRHVEADEYEISGLVLPKLSATYDYQIYVSDVGYTSSEQTVANNRPGRNDYKLYANGKTNSKRIVDFGNITERSGFEDYTDGVKAVYVVIRGIKKSISYSVDVDIRFRFDQNEELQLPENDRIDTEGELTNEGYMRMFKSDSSTDLCAASDYDKSHQQGSGELFDSAEYKAEDKLMDSKAYTDNYDPDTLTNNELLYHAWSSVYLRDITTTLSTLTQVTSELRNKDEGSGYDIDIASQGSIISDNYSAYGISGDLSSFSLYTRIPSVLTFDHQLSEIALKNCYAKDVYGHLVSLADFKDHVVYRLFEADNGDMIIAADFDFSDSPLDVSSFINVRLEVPAVFTYADFKASDTKNFSVETYIMLQDDGIQKIIAKTTPTTDTEDFNNNGFTGEVMASSKMGITYEEILEWQDTAEKFVKSYSDDTWNISYDPVKDVIYSQTSVNAHSSLIGEEENNRSRYFYKLSVDLGSRSSDITFTDILEDETGSAWKGNLSGIDFTAAKEQGLVPTVYYSTNKTEYKETVTNADKAEYYWNEDDFTKESDEQWNSSHDLWTAPVNNIASLVVKLSTADLTNGFISKQQVSIILNMTAPEYTVQSPIGQNTINAHKVYYTGHTDLYDTRKDAQSAEAKVTLKEPVLLLTLKKTDGDTGKPLLGAKFSFYTDSDCTTPVIENVGVNNLGEVYINSLTPGTYYYKEVTAPDGYLLDTTVHEIDLTGNDKSYKQDSGLVIANEKLKGTLIFTKKDAEDPDGVGLKGAEYELYYPTGINVCTDKNNVYQETGGTKSTFVTDKNGEIEITGLPWGVYYFQETTAPDGYEINDEKIWITITKNTNKEEQSTKNAIVVYHKQTDEEKTASVKIIKYDQDGVTPLENAWFSLQIKQSDGNWKTVEGYEYLKTAKNGSITINDLKFGTYRFVENISPVGYEMPVGIAANSYEIVLDASTAESIQTVTMTNNRIAGSATLRKYSDNGTPINGAKFNLYLVNGEIDDNSVPGDAEDTLIRSGLTTATRDGRIGMLETVTGLEWGRYYFKEIYAPAGYEKRDTPYEFTINASNASTIVGEEFDPINDRKRGEVILIKKAGEPVDTGTINYNTGDGIKGAVFSLYSSSSNEKLWVVPDDPAAPTKYTVGVSTDTNAMQEMTTDSTGQIHIDGIEWGSYYLDEVTAPTGFSTTDKVRFTVNQLNCLSVQELECEDFGVKCLITIDKKIDDKLDAFGTPTFMFKVEKLDSSDNTEKDYLKEIILSGEDKTGSVSMYVEPGRYRISEIKVNRYYLSDTSYVDAGTTVPAANRTITNNVFEFTISGSGSTYETAEVYFYNILENYSGLSHNSAVVNIVPSKRKVTGFSVELKNQPIECADEMNHSYNIQVSDLRGYITFDDGETREMTDEEFARVFPFAHLADDTVTTWTVDNGFEFADTSFIENAVYTDENGKVFKANFLATIASHDTREAQKVLFINDKDNASLFSVGNKNLTSNTVYYGEENGEITAITGTYVKPVTVSGYQQIQAWKIIGGSDNGTILPPLESSVKKYLADNYDSGLRDLKLQAVLSEDVYDFYPAEEEQELVAPKDGIYFIECWGGNGGNAVVNGTVMAEGGKGGYSYAWLYLKEGETVHLVVGGNGGDATELNAAAQGGYNGGASATSSADTYYAAGGGASHFYIEKVGDGLLSDYSSDDDKSKIIIVAGGGGGGAYSTTDGKARTGGNGGGETGGPGAGTNPGNGGTQSAGGTGTTSGSFAQGGGNTSRNESGGGGGWYGGGSGTDGASAGGGSGYVNESRVIIGETIGGNDAPKDDGHATVSYLEDEINLPDSSQLHQFIVPKSGYYFLEAWGAAGGSSLKNDASIAADGSFDDSAVQEGGRGGYACGTVYLEKDQVIYYTVGKMGSNSYINTVASINEGSQSGGYGGGGDQTALDDAIWNSGSGGGATCFMLNKTDNGNLSDYSSDKVNLLLVAGGGGGSGYYYNTGSSYGNGIGGSGGGAQAQAGYSVTSSGVSVTGSGSGGTQSAGGTGANSGSFGHGGQGTNGTTGGGSGLYGGGSGLASGGGSGYVNIQYMLESRNVNGIYEGSYTDSSGNVITPEYIPTFAGAIVDDGIVGTDCNDTQMYGNRGDGFARITYIPRTQVVDYSYTGYAQSFTASVSGYYKLEAWGAQGGDTSKNGKMVAMLGGRGGYSYGTVYLREGQTIYLAVGGAGGELFQKPSGTTLPGGFNGGSQALADATSNTQGSGGGATHFALSLRGNGVLSDYESKKKDVLLVAGGGGGAYSSSGIQYYSAGGNGGGENGGDAIIYYTRSSALNGQTYNGTTYSYYQGLTIPGGGQTAKQNDGIYVYGTFGQGAIPNGNSPRDYVHSGTDSGAGGGWYGGARLCSYTRSGMAGGGGSGHCSDLYLVSDYGYATIGGDNVFAAPDGTDEYGHSGDGYARVTLVEEADISVYDDPEADIYEFDYTGAVQTFTAPADGNYKLEAWGAQGGGTSGYPGGSGAYTSGEIYLYQGETIYIYVGGAGQGQTVNQTTSNNAGGFNGGGIGLLNHSGNNAVRVFGSGGGATDFRLVASDADDGWSGFDSLKSRIMVAAGGGGGHYNNTAARCKPGGYGGALVGGEGACQSGNDNSNIATGGTQIAGGYCVTFKTGIGQFGYADDTGCAGGGHCGGGSGYYAGGTSQHTSAGAGGSSFVSGYYGCNAISEESVEGGIIHTNQANHYSGKVFKNSEMLAGNEPMPDHDGFENGMTGNTGNGFAKITYLG